MNLCRTCGHDFASIRAFDAHRIGRHAYTEAEGLELRPPRHGWSQVSHPRRDAVGRLGARPVGTLGASPGTTQPAQEGLLFALWQPRTGDRDGHPVGLAEKR